jgi:hypothetical protein
MIVQVVAHIGSLGNELANEMRLMVVAHSKVS